jgi:hypothetical protein
VLKVTVLVLKHVRVAVELPAAQTCFGQPMLSNRRPRDSGYALCEIWDSRRHSMHVEWFRT